MRATSLLEGGFSAAGLSTFKRKGEEDDVDIDLDIDEDDTAKFGAQQYDENSLKPYVQDTEGDDASMNTASADGLASHVIDPEAQTMVIIDSLKAKIRQQVTIHVCLPFSCW